MDVSAAEQEIACRDDKNAHYKTVVELMSGKGGINNMERLRLVLLFALRYEGQ